MTAMTDMYEGIKRILARDSRYDRAAYFFIFQALEYTVEQSKHNGHVSVHHLLDGIRDYACEKFGYLARTVFECWRIHSTADFGEIIFNLVDEHLLKKTDADRKEDAVDRYDFTEVFETDFQLKRAELDY